MVKILRAAVCVLSGKLIASGRILRTAGLPLLLMVLVSASVVLPSGCKPVKKQWEPAGKLPEGILEKDTMIALLVDIHLAEGDMLDRSLPAEEQEVLLREHYGMILARHRITAKQLQESYAYYIQRPLTMNGMYEQVIEELNRLQAAVQAEGKNRESSAARSKTPDSSDSISPQTPPPGEGRRRVPGAPPGAGNR